MSNATKSSIKKTDNKAHICYWKYHIIFWVFYFSFNVMRWGSYYNDFYYSLKSNLIEFPIHIALSYFHAYYLIPTFIVKKKYFLYVLVLIISLTLMYFIKTTLTYQFLNSNVWPEAMKNIEAKFFLHYITVSLGEIYTIAMTTSIKLTYDWIESNKRNQELEKLNLKSEINFLRAQIQPHFFFNTLNNLYALTLEKSDKASEVVLKLSGLMQYVLYEAKDDRVLLRKELFYIQSYLDLEKLRFGKRLKYNIEINGNIENVMVPPLLFVVFIENCFKHSVGINNTDIKIDIKFDTTSRMTIFEVLNPIPEIVDKRIRQVDEGIGIKNARKRLQLNYGSDYSLEISSVNNLFRVILAMPNNNG